MYKIFADDTLIYDSTLEDYKIGKGQITLEVSKSGSFVFSVYPEHFYYDSFVRLKTIITVYRSGRIVFRGRILNDVTDNWNNKVITCEGELGFLQDSIIRPFSFTGTPENLFKKFVNEHNSQVDEFKRFKIGTVTVVDPNNYINRENSNYESALNNLNSRLIEDSLGGYFYITHGDTGTDTMPTLNYLADFSKVSSQKVEFGSNLKNYTKTVKADDIATAIIPLGAEIGEGDSKQKLTIASVNNSKDYVYSEEGVALYGWIYKTVEWNDVTDANNLKTKAEAYVKNVVNQSITIELTVIDLHLIDPTIESFNVCDYMQAVSAPHQLDMVLLCNKQTLDLLKPDNDTLTLGSTYSTFTEVTRKTSSTISSVKSNVANVNNRITVLDQNFNNVFNVISGDQEAMASAIVDNARNIQALSNVVDEIETIYDRSSSDSGKNWGYTGGINSNGIAHNTLSRDLSSALANAKGVIVTFEFYEWVKSIYCREKYSDGSYCVECYIDKTAPDGYNAVGMTVIIKNDGLQRINNYGYYHGSGEHVTNYGLAMNIKISKIEVIR